jgi:hypothetical protein
MTEYVLTEDDKNDLQYSYDLIGSYPRPIHRMVVHKCITDFVKINKKLKLRKEYKYTKYCTICHSV